MKRFFLFAISLIALAVPILAAPPGRGVGPRVGVVYGGRVGPRGWYDPYYGFYSYYGEGLTPTAGTVKLDTSVKDAEVFINGSYAGTVSKLKTMTMLPGNYTVELRAFGRESYKRDIFVIPGKTIKLTAEMRVL
ncbi:MAG: PEGA domain-containing protein [Acidobacteriaceae bacterium]|nr:PEGA domain-containing protein [Acidobacteriaceae bacterium]